MSTPARTQDTHQPFSGWSREEVELVRRTVAPPDATDHELALYLRLCRAYGLDPFRRELVFVRRRRKRPDGSYEVTPVFITSRDGYLRAAQRDPGYAGIMSAAVHENDHFEFDVENQKIVHRFGKDRGKLVGAWAIAYHKHRPPVMAYVPLDEYYDPSSDTWRLHPSAMICKVAEVYVLRRQFHLSGIVAREEVELDLREQAHEAPALPAPAAARPQPAPPRTEPTRKQPALPNPTEFWRAVRLAARAAGSDPIEWVRKRAGGESDIRRIPAETVTRIYSEAMAAARQGTAASTQAQDTPAPQPAEQPAASTTRAPDGHREALSLLQARWRERSTPPQEQAAQVRAISRGRTAIPAELTADEIHALLEVLADTRDNNADPNP